MRLARGIEQMVAGLPFSPAWQLGANGLWIDPSSNLLVKATQPLVGAFTLGNNWGVAGGLYTHAAGSASSITQAILIVGNRYKVSWAITAITTGTITTSVGAAADAAQSTVASFVTELDCTTNTTLGFAASSSCDATIRIDSVENLSLAQVTPMAAVGALAGSVLSQGTATAQPWQSSALINGNRAMQFDGTADCLTSNLANTAWDWLHQSSDGFTIYLMMRSTDVAMVYKMLFNTAFGVGTGITLYTGGSALCLATWAAGTLKQYIFKTVSADTTYVVAIRCKPLTISMRVNGVEATNVVLDNYVSAGHCHNTFQVGVYSSGYFYAGSMGDLHISAGYHSSAQVSQIEAYLARKWGVTLP